MTGRSVLWVGLTGLVAAVATTVLGTLGIGAGASSLSTTSAVLWRTVLALVALAVVVLLMVRRAPWSPVAAWLGAGLLSFALNPLTWTAGADAGGALFGVVATGSAALGLAVDLATWLAVTVGAVLVAERSLDEEG